MKHKGKLSLFVVLLIAVIGLSTGFQPTENWYAEDSTPTFFYQRFSTQQWLAMEALQALPDARIAWINRNLMAFWQGVEAPNNGLAALEVGLNENDYGDIETEALYLDVSGITVTNDSLAVRASEEYDKLVAELGKVNSNYTLAAFYAGALSHYVSQAGYWVTIWDETLWGQYDSDNRTMFDLAIEFSLSETRLPYNLTSDDCFRLRGLSDYDHRYISLTPAKQTPRDAYNATIDLAKGIHPYAHSLGSTIKSRLV